jgi:VWFA-related protein
MRTFFVLAIVSALVVGIGAGIGAALDAQDLPSIKVDVDVVSVLTTVRDKKGALIANLQKDDFTVLEDGKPQTIKYFTKETDLPLTIGMLVDVSGSQRNLIDIERSAASQFFTQVLRKKDEAFLISFGEETELLQDYTGSPRLLKEGLNQLRVSSGVGGIHRPVRHAGSPAELSSTTPST